MQPVDLILAERERQFNLPGTEHDARKSPNDWITTIVSILGEGVERSGIPPTKQDFERSITKAAAVCLAALEHTALMSEQKKLTL
jgi:hypothetical protein